MIYVYDLLVNFNDELYSFYEWESSDEVEHLKKGILVKITDFLYQKFLNSNIIVDEEFLNTIKNKSTILKNKKHQTLTYMAIFTNGKDTVGLTFSSMGKILEKTRFTLQDELELLDISKSLKVKKITFRKILNNKTIPDFNTRDERRIIKKILFELNNLKEQDEVLNYLYYEWFNKKAIKSSIYNELIDSIKLNYTDKHDDFLKLLNLITIKNNV